MELTVNIKEQSKIAAFLNLIKKIDLSFESFHLGGFCSCWEHTD